MIPLVSDKVFQLMPAGAGTPVGLAPILELGVALDL